MTTDLQAPESTAEEAQESSRWRRMDRSVWAVRAASWAVLLGVWQYLSSNVVEKFILPPPWTIAKKMGQIIESGQLLEHFGASFTLLCDCDRAGGPGVFRDAGSPAVEVAQ
jgi:hypothetical protein